MRTIAILGMMGAGKTTVGTLVAGRLGVEMVDSDTWIERRYGRDARMIAAEQGVERLHALEAEMLTSVLDSGGPVVVTPAASVIERPELRARLTNETLPVFLDLPRELMAERMARGEHRRPMDDQQIRATAARRHPLFVATAAVSLDATLRPDLIADRIIELC